MNEMRVLPLGSCQRLGDGCAAAGMGLSIPAATSITNRAEGHRLLDGAQSEASAGAGVSLRAERLLLLRPTKTRRGHNGHVSRQGRDGVLANAISARLIDP
jgi:hypothetical protein